MKKSFIRQLFYASSQGNRNRLNMRYVFLVLMLLSLISVFLPAHWTGPTEKFCQTWIGPPGRLSILAAQKIKSEKLSSAQSKNLTNEHLKRLLSVISIQLNQLKQQNRQLLKLRKLISEQPTLVPAHVIGFDSLGLASLEIDRGSFAHLQSDLPVIAAVPTELIGTDINPDVILAAGTLIGTIAYEPGPYTARVKLISSPDRKLTAFVVRFANGKSRKIARIRVKGTKKGYMLADMVPLKHKVKVGDFVILQNYKKFLLPSPMTIGIVTKVSIRTDNRLLADLIIKPVISKTALDTIYILVPKEQTQK